MFAGTSCFFIEPDVWDFMKQCEDVVSSYGTVLLPEIHEHYTMQQKIADKDYYVYDFALPMLLINALYYGKTEYLKHWLEICPRKQFTTLDTHDGINSYLSGHVTLNETFDRYMACKSNLRRTTKHNYIYSWFVTFYTFW
mgnify:CR=1 FL=1